MRVLLVCVLASACPRPPAIPTTGNAVCATATAERAAEICDVAIERCVVIYGMPDANGVWPMGPFRGACQHMGRGGRTEALKDPGCVLDKDSGLVTCVMQQ